MGDRGQVVDMLACQVVDCPYDVPIGAKTEQVEDGQTLHVVARHVRRDAAKKYRFRRHLQGV